MNPEITESKGNPETENKGNHNYHKKNQGAKILNFSFSFPLTTIF